MSIPPEIVERARRADILELARSYGVALKRTTTTEFSGPCPACRAGRDRFSVNVKKQIWNCRACGKGGRDAISLVMHVDGVEFRQAVELLTDGAWLPSKPRAPIPTARADDSSLPRAMAIWGASVPIIGTAGEDYLRGRRIVLDDVPEYGGLRFHPRCPWESGTAACIVARYTDAITAEPRGLWRRLIDGSKPKSLGLTSGCVIRLWPDDTVETAVVLGEGVETTLAAATRITYRGTYLRPAWAAGNAGNMAHFPVLSGIEALTLLVDHDENGAGERAAEQCKRTWIDAGREVIRLLPADTDRDFNDLVKP